eukprot:scaffold15663_cov109-Isochrysis_galbana.AAC.1
MARVRNNSSPLAEGNPLHLSTRTKQGYPPSPHLTKRLNSSSPIHYTTISPNTTSHNTVNRPQQNPTTQTERIRQRHTEWVPEAGPTQEKHRRKRPVGSQWEP